MKLKLASDGTFEEDLDMPQVAAAIEEECKRMMDYFVSSSSLHRIYFSGVSPYFTQN